MIERLAWLVPVLPLLAAVWIALGYLFGWNRGERGERETAGVAQWAAGGSWLLMAALGVQGLLRGPPGQVGLGRWLAVGDLHLGLSLTLDGLGLGFGLLVATIAFLTLKFSVSYLHREEGFQRFFLVMCLFTGAMQLIALGGSALVLFIGWELAGVASYLLIGYAFDRPVATGNATRAFVTNRIGDAGFLLGLFLALRWLGGLEWPAIAQGAAPLDRLSADLVAGAFLLAALAKSAQVPFAPWIGRALEGPTPSSAIFYGALMVHAGVYLLIRLEPLLLQAPAVLALTAALGLLTALYGWLGGLAQTDVKSALGFSTTAQVGLLFLWCGLGWFDLAAWHLGLHASWRALQFLRAPALMHLVSRPARPVPPWLGRARGLHTAALQRFWLDPFADWLLVRPTEALARDLRAFDDQVVARAIGLPDQASAISSPADWGDPGRPGGADEDLVHGRGILGRVLEWAASLLHWFEERLVLRGGGEGLLAAIHRLGTLLNRVEGLLSQPRYLLLLILATFVVIL